MSTNPLASSPPRDDAAIRDWLVIAVRGFRKRIDSVAELHLAREAAACALRGQRLNNSSSAGSLAASRHCRKIQTRAYDLTKTAQHIGNFNSVDFLLGADANELMAVRQRRPQLGAVSIYPKQGEIV